MTTYGRPRAVGSLIALVCLAGTLVPGSASAQQPASGAGAAGRLVDETAAPVTPEVVEIPVAGVDPEALADLRGVVPVLPDGHEDDAARSDRIAPLLEPGTAGSPIAPDALTAELDTAPFAVFGVTWRESGELADLVVRYRVRTTDGWGEWAALEPAHDEPDTGSADDESGGRRGGTDPVVVGEGDGIQVWAQAERGRLSDLRIVLVDPGERPADAALATSAVALGASPVVTSVADRRPAADARQAATVRPASRSLVAGRVGTVTASAVWARSAPPIVSRAGWGADESLRPCDADYSRDVSTVAIHHTASANDYSAAQVPGIIRGIYAYHVSARGWCDIGYNFLVDRFGRVFEGRAGGIDKPVAGVHAGGFNSRSVGISALGTFTSVAPSAEMAEAISQLVAWKSMLHGLDPQGSIVVPSGGGDSTLPAGTPVLLAGVYGHRDVQSTSCPGERLYALLPAIRSRAAGLLGTMVRQSPVGHVDSIAVARGGIRVQGWGYDPDSAAPLQVDVVVQGQRTRLTADAYRADVGHRSYDATLSLKAGRYVVCVESVNVGGGADTVVGCEWVTVTASANPFGSLDHVLVSGDQITVKGWALDPDSRDPIDVHVYVGTRGEAVHADGPREDVHRNVPGAGPAHAFEHTMRASPGTHTVCVYAINVGPGFNDNLGCRTVTTVAPDRPPRGAVEAATALPGAVTVRGWAWDPDSSAPIAVAVRVGGQTQQWLAQVPRPDVTRTQGTGTASVGFEGTVLAPVGRHEVCVTALGAAGGASTALGCSTVEVTQTNTAPIGEVESLISAPGRLTIRGWAHDPDTRDPIQLHVYVDGVGSARMADVARPDVARRVSSAGPSHGFQVSVPAAPGARTVCVYAIDSVFIANVLLGCRAIDVPSAERLPIGSLDFALAVPGGVRVGGWALDPDSVEALPVHVYVGGAGWALSADGTRQDIGRLFPDHGAGRAFEAVVPASPGRHAVCAYGINRPGPGANALLGCREVVVP